jgi:hypothetical protein
MKEDISAVYAFCGGRREEQAEASVALDIKICCDLEKILPLWRYGRRGAGGFSWLPADGCSSQASGAICEELTLEWCERTAPERAD